VQQAASAVSRAQRATRGDVSSRAARPSAGPVSVNTRLPMSWKLIGRLEAQAVGEQPRSSGHASMRSHAKGITTAGSPAASTTAGRRWLPANTTRIAVSAPDSTSLIEPKTRHRRDGARVKSACRPPRPMARHWLCTRASAAFAVGSCRTYSRSIRSRASRLAHTSTQRGSGVRYVFASAPMCAAGRKIASATALEQGVAGSNPVSPTV